VDASVIDEIETFETGQSDSLSFKEWPQAWLLSEDEEQHEDAARKEGKGSDLLWQAAAVTEEEKLLRSRKHTEELVKVPFALTADCSCSLCWCFSSQLYELQFHRLHQELRRNYFDFMGNDPESSSNRAGKQAGKHQLRKRRKRSKDMIPSRCSKYLQGHLHCQRAVTGILPPGEIRKNASVISTGLWSSKRQVRRTVANCREPSRTVANCRELSVAEPYWEELT
jgi:hypothetical protein